MNTFPQPGQQNFQQFAQGAPAPAPQQFQQAPQQFQPQGAPAPQQFQQPPVQQQYAPAPQQFQQPQGAPAPQQFQQPPAQQQYQQAPAQPLAQPGAAFGPGAFDGATLVGHQDPTPNEGEYIFELVDTILKTQNGRTHVTTLQCVDNGNNPQASVVGSILGCPQKLDGSQWSFKYGTAAMMAMVMAMTGFADEAQFKTQIPQWSALMNAICDNKQQLAGNPWPPNPLKGRRARCSVKFSGKYTKGTTPKPIMNFAWSVLAA